MLERRGAGHEARRNEVVKRGSAIAKELGLEGICEASTIWRVPKQKGRCPASVALAPAPASSPDAPSFTLAKEGELWSFESGGRPFRLKDSRGVQMLAELLLHPNREFHVLTLAGAEAVDTGDSGEVIDREAAQAYREHVEDLREQLAEAESWSDRARADGLRQQLEQVTAEIARGVGLGGRSRRAGAAAERARVNVKEGCATPSSESESWTPSSAGTSIARSEPGPFALTSQTDQSIVSACCTTKIRRWRARRNIVPRSSRPGIDPSAKAKRMNMNAEAILGLLTPVTYFTMLAIEAIWPAREFPKIRWWRLVGFGFLAAIVGLGAVIPMLLPMEWLAQHRLLDGSRLGVVGVWRSGLLVSELAG